MDVREQLGATMVSIAYLRRRLHRQVPAVGLRARARRRLSEIKDRLTAWTWTRNGRESSTLLDIPGVRADWRWVPRFDLLSGNYRWKVLRRRAVGGRPAASFLCVDCWPIRAVVDLE